MLLARSTSTILCMGMYVICMYCNIVLQVAIKTVSGSKTSIVNLKGRVRPADRDFRISFYSSSSRIPTFYGNIYSTVSDTHGFVAKVKVLK